MHKSEWKEVSRRECPEFFDDVPTIPEKVFCKVYNDGGHYVAVPYFPNRERRKPREDKPLSELREHFNSLYAYTLTEHYNRAQTLEFLRNNLCTFFDYKNELESFIAEEMKRKARNLHARKNRFRRKANM